MSLTTRAFEFAHNFVAMPAAVPTRNYPARCEVSDALDNLLGFVIGNLKGLASPVAQVILVVLALALIVVGSRSNSRGIVRGIVFVLAGLLLLTVAAPLISSFGSNAC